VSDLGFDDLISFTLINSILVEDPTIQGTQPGDLAWCKKHKVDAQYFKKIIQPPKSVDWFSYKSDEELEEEVFSTSEEEEEETETEDDDDDDSVE